MKKNLSNIVLIIGIIIAILLLGTMFNNYNLKRTVSACILAQKQTSKSFDPKKAKELCEKDIKKSTSSSGY